MVVARYPPDPNPWYRIRLNVKQVYTDTRGNIEFTENFRSEEEELDYSCTTEQMKYKIENILHGFGITDVDYVESISGTLSVDAATQLRQIEALGVYSVLVMDYVSIYQTAASEYEDPEFEQDFDMEDEEYNYGRKRNLVSQSAIDRLERTRYIRGGDEVCCAICTEGMIGEDEMIEIPCYHLLHSNCLVRWLQTDNSCPLCRRVVVKTEAPP